MRLISCFHPTSQGLIVLMLLGPIAVGSAEAGKPDFSSVPGVIIDHSPASTQRFIGSPSLAILPSGSYVASHDFFGPGTPNNQTVVFASKDKGLTWTRLAELKGQWWSSLFVATFPERTFPADQPVPDMKTHTIGFVQD